MATPKYDNDYVNRREARNRLGITLEQKPIEPYVQEGPTVDQLLAAAKATYNRGTDFLANIDTKAAIQQEASRRMLERNANEPSVMDSPLTKAKRLVKDIVRPIPQAAEKAALLGAMIGAPEVAIPSELLLGGFAGERMIEGGVKRLKEHPFMSAFDALMTIPLVRQGTAGARKLGSVLKAEAEARAAARGVPMVPEQFAPNTSGYTPGAPFGEEAMPITRLTEQGAPNVSGYQAGGEFGESAMPLSRVTEQGAPNVSGYTGAVDDVGEAALPIQVPPSVIERYAPNISGVAEGAESVVLPQNALDALMQTSAFSGLPKTATVANRARQLPIPKPTVMTLKEIAAARAKERFGRAFRSE